MRSKVLITSCFARGGVVSARELAAKYLEEEGYDVSFASYAPYKLYPDLSVPLWQGLYKEAKIRPEGKHWWVGCMLPEWEFMRSESSALWDSLIEKYDNHLVVSGPALAAYPFVAKGIHPLCWLGSSYWDERSTQYKSFSPLRKAITLVDKIFCEKQESEILNKCPILAVSSYSAAKLLSVAPNSKCGILPAPIDTHFFSPPQSERDQSTVCIGFAGRLNDSRKNIELLLQTAALLKKDFRKLRVLLAGDEPNSLVREKINSLGIETHVESFGRLSDEKLLSFYRHLDVFVIPSLQEGLCIAGLEAMATGVPIVSTRCGGPEDYVREGKTGFLCNFDAEDMHKAIRKCLDNPELREGATELARTEFSKEAVKAKFLTHFYEAQSTKKTQKAA